MQNKLFQPLSVGPRELRNRIIFGSHTTNYAQDNVLSNRHANYYAARAEGGAGAIVLEERIVHPSDLPYANALLGYLPETPAAIANVTSPSACVSLATSIALGVWASTSAWDAFKRRLQATNSNFPGSLFHQR